MSATVAGAGVAAALALTWIVLGFWAFVVVAIAMAIGALVGRALSGALDVRALAAALRGRRMSS